MVDDCTPQCWPTCPGVFDRLRAFVHVRGGTRVEWTLGPDFHDPGPYTFQLQTGRSSAADDWQNVGLPVVDTYYAVDDSQRVFGQSLWTHYRVVLTTPVAVYYSEAVSCDGDLDRQDWRRAREILRMELLRLRKSPAGAPGYLLKRRLYGEHCDCLNFQTREVDKPDHLRCYGTGIVGGYFPAVECTYAELELSNSRLQIEDQVRGTINYDGSVQARLLAVPSIESYDVWVDRDQDLRWYIHSVTNVVEIRRVPLVVNCELRLANFQDVIYDFPVSNRIQG